MLKERVKKSEKLTPDVKKAFKAWVIEQGTKTDAAIALGLSRMSLDMVLAKGSCRPSTASKIKEVLNLTEDGSTNNS